MASTPADIDRPGRLALTRYNLLRVAVAAILLAAVAFMAWQLTAGPLPAANSRFCAPLAHPRPIR